MTPKPKLFVAVANGEGQGLTAAQHTRPRNRGAKILNVNRKWFVQAADDMQRHSREQIEPIVVSLFRAKAQRVRKALTRKLQSREDAEDAAQEVFLRLWRHEANGELRADSATAYMHTLMNTIAIDVHRRRKTHAVPLHDTVEDQELEAPSCGQEETLQWREVLSRLVECLKELPEATQRVFLLYHLQGVSYAEIGSRLNLSIRSVERHMARALRHCRNRMGDCV